MKGHVESTAPQAVSTECTRPSFEPSLPPSPLAYNWRGPNGRGPEAYPTFSPGVRIVPPKRETEDSGSDDSAASEEGEEVEDMNTMT